MSATPEPAPLSAFRFAVVYARAGAGVLLLALVAPGLWELVRWTPETSAGDILFALVLLPAAWTAGRRLRRRAGSPAARTAWRLTGLALSLTLAAQVVQAWYQLPALPGGDHLSVWPLLLALAVACHEAGHAGAAQLLGLRWKPFARFPWAAGIAVRAPDGGLPPRDDLALALAGPLASFALAAVAFPLVPSLGALSAFLGVMNLVPFLRGSDGWRAVRAARQIPV